MKDHNPTKEQKKTETQDLEIIVSRYWPLHKLKKVDKEE